MLYFHKTRIIDLQQYLQYKLPADHEKMEFTKMK